MGWDTGICWGSVLITRPHRDTGLFHTGITVVDGSFFRFVQHSSQSCSVKKTWPCTRIFKTVVGHLSYMVYARGLTFHHIIINFVCWSYLCPCMGLHFKNISIQTTNIFVGRPNLLTRLFKTFFLNFLNFFGKILSLCALYCLIVKETSPARIEQWLSRGWD